MNELIVDAIKEELESLGWEYEVEDEYGSYSISSWVNHRVGRILILINVEDDKTSLNTIHMHASDVYSNPMAFKILNDENWTTALKLAIRHDNAKQTYDLWCSSAPVLNDSIWAEDVIREMIFGSVCAIERCYDHIKQHNGNKSITQEPSVIGKLATHECKPDVGIVDDSLMRELVLAVAAGNTEEVRDLLLQPGIDINGAVDGYTPLSAASLQGHTDVVRLLLSVSGLDVNNADHKDGETPLLSSAGHGYTEIVKLLLAAPGINVNKANNDGITPLHAAAGQGHAEIVKLLLTVPGIDVNTEEAEHSPLALASFMGHTEVVRLLLSCPGIDVNRGNPLLVAKHEGHTAFVRLLLAAGT